MKRIDFASVVAEDDKTLIMRIILDNGKEIYVTVDKKNVNHNVYLYDGSI